MGRRENTVETYLKEQAAVRLGAECRKYTSPGHGGVSDQLIIMRGGRLIFAEVKTHDGTEQSNQVRERKVMLTLGHEAVILYGKVDVDVLMARLVSGQRVC